jgi:hypothetical protein
MRRTKPRNLPRGEIGANEAMAPPSLRGIGANEAIEVARGGIGANEAIRGVPALGRSTPG